MTQRRLKVGFTYDAKADYPLQPGDAPDKYAEFDNEETLAEIIKALSASGHEIVRIGHAKSLIARLTAGERWDIIFNIAEGIKGRNRESQVPAILEVYDIPYTGSDALTMGITLDKAVAKMVLNAHGLSTPRFLEACTIGDLKRFNLKFPVIVKPSEEGTSKGITSESVAQDAAALEKRVRWVIETYDQPALVEEFIFGQEFTVAVIGNEEPVALPPVQVSIRGKTDLGDDFYTHARADWDNDEIKYLCPSPAPKELLKKIEDLATGAYTALGVRDLGRIDIRVDRAGVPYFLECNPLPNLGLIDVFPLVAQASNTTYEKLLCRILEYGIKRYNLL